MNLLLIQKIQIILILVTCGSFALFVSVPTVFAQINTEQLNDITINATIKKGDYIDSNLYFQNATISFGSIIDICPMNCLKELQDTTFNEFGKDRILSGTLKVEDKGRSTPEVKSFVYYKLSGTFHLTRSMENEKTGEEILFYTGSLGIDPEEAIFNPEFEFDSEVKLTENTFDLSGSKTT